MDSARITELLHPYIDGLSPAQLAQVSTYLDLLLRWNAKMNLTSIRDPESIVTRHFGESFFLARQLSFLATEPSKFVITSEARDLQFDSRSPDHQIARSPDILDLGSGAGFPGIPLKIALPDLTITLVEAHHRKAVFLREVLRALNLDAEVKNVRAEDLPPASADIVTLRAVEKFDSILPTAARLVRSGPEAVMDVARPRAAGALALLIGSSQIAPAQEILSNWHFQQAIPVPGSEKRVIQLVEPNW